MYTILLVDDEKSIREYLPRVIPFEKYNFMVKDTAINGQEALEKLPAVQPDLIILDVRMPIMDGLEFVKSIRKSKYTDTLIVMLSGYSDFIYAKEAMKYDVKEYLCKPVDEDEMSQLLEKIHNELDQYQNEKKLRTIRKRMKMLNKLYNGGKMDRKQFSGYTLMTCVLLSYSREYQKENLRIIMQECLAKQLGEVDTIQFSIKGSRYIYLVDTKVFEEFSDKRSFAKNLLKELKKEKLGCAILFDSYIFDHQEKTFREDFSNHGYEMLSVLFYEKEEILEYRPNRYKMGEELHMECKYLEEIRKHLSLMDKKEILRVMDRLFNEIEKLRLGIQYVQKIHYRIYYLIIEEIEKYVNGNQEENYIARPEWMEFPCFMSFEKWKEFQLSLMIEGFSFIEREYKMNNLGVNREIITYIHAHYKEQITLKQVADQFFMNAAYLGRTFRKAMGICFNQYVNQIRISEAKKLLIQTDKLIYEIAEEVGYTDSKYFVVKFLEKVGKSPTKYRNQM